MPESHRHVALLAVIGVFIAGALTLMPASGVPGSMFATAIVSASQTGSGAISLSLAATTLPSGKMTALPFSSVAWSTGNFGSFSGSTFTFSKGGTYLLTSWTELEANTAHSIVPFKNGGGLLTNDPGSGDNMLSIALSVQAGDTVSLKGIHYSGSNKILTSNTVTIINIDPQSSGGLQISGSGLAFNSGYTIQESVPGSVLTFRGKGPNAQSSLHLLAPAETPLPTDTLSEVVLMRTADQSWGGNYGRWSFTTFGTALNNTSGIYGEFGGTVQPTEFIFNYGYEDTPGHFNSYEPMRLMAGSDIGNVGFGLGALSPRDVIQLHVSNIGSVGIRDSHAIRFSGKANNGTERAVEWRQFADVTTTAGASTFLLQNRIGGGTAFSDKFAITSDGKVGIGTNNPSAALDVLGAGAIPGTLELDGDVGGCLKIRDTDNAGWTYCTTLNGTLRCSVNPC